MQVCLPLNLLDASGYSVSTLLTLQSGGLVGLATCPDRHVAVAAAADGSVCALDYRSNAVLQQRRFPARISSMAVLQPPPGGSSTWRPLLLLGHADGAVRLVGRCSDSWALLAAARPHKVGAGLCFTGMSSNGALLQRVY
jgi:hypothetical protein